jgi:hypothetical protein
MNFTVNSSHRSFVNLRSWFGVAILFLYIAVLAAIVYFDDLQIVGRGESELPTIYNVRFLGIKILDAVSILLALLLVLYTIVRERTIVTPFHKYVAVMFLVYCYAGLVGFIYSFFFNYDYLIWLQDFQHTLYMTAFFLYTFHFLDSWRKWKVFVVCFLAFLALKNVLITYKTLAGIGRAIGDWAFRASSNAEFAYFPMMFFPIVILILKSKSRVLRILLLLVSFIYLFNSLLGIFRTVWVMLILGSIYLLTQLDKKSRLRLVLWSTAGLGSCLLAVAALYPRFLALAWNYKFASIFSWSIEGDRSNATRTLEIINVTDYVFRNFAFLQGMGLGAWWDDSARRLLPDAGAGILNKTRFHTTHLLYLSQFLKLGVVAMFFYWSSLYRIFKRVSKYMRTISWDRWEKSVVLGLNIGLLCAFISSADYVRLFTMIGINIGISASFLSLDLNEWPEEKEIATETQP